MRDYRGDLHKIFFSAVDYANPEKLVRENISIVDGHIIVESELNFKPEKVYMFAFGKAACGMAKGLLSVCPVDRGVVASNTIEEFPRNIDVIKAGHPLPDVGSLRAAEAMLTLAAEADEETLCIFLVSGGGSAILCSPAFGITLEEKVKTFDLLIKSGADIEEINAVRRHISDVKGGRLAEAAAPAKCVTLAVSDVLSGAPNAIASGPTYPDSSTWANAAEVVERYRLMDKLPLKVAEVLKDGEAGRLPETLMARGADYHYITIGSNLEGMHMSAEKAAELGYKVRVLGQLDCDVTDAAEMASSIVNETLFFESLDQPVCMIFGGEVTVDVKGSGKGGRCQQFALEYLLLGKPTETYALFASTDGMDGDTDAAGAFADCFSEKEDGVKYAENNDAYNFFAKNNSLFKTGLTGTNINDLYIILIPESQIKDRQPYLSEESSYTCSDR